MHVLAYAMGFAAVKATERQQQQCVDSALVMVERVLSHQQDVRRQIRDGRIRVDTLVGDALKAARPDGKQE